MMQQGQLQVSVLVKGRPITEFSHEGQIFVEGRPGSDFEIQVTNKSPGRALIVISVDGLSIMDGKPAGEDSAGYMVQSQCTVTIPGWKLDNAQVAKFTFGSRKDSYAQQGRGNATNCGVIGVMMFTEKRDISPYFSAIYGTNMLAPQNNITRRINGPLFGPMGPKADPTPNPFLSQVGGTVDSSSLSVASNASASVNNLGTAFGDATDFASREVEFEKGNLIATAVMFYDDSRGLKARGIVLERASKLRYQTSPNPFPAASVSCTPPKGWGSK